MNEAIYTLTKNFEIEYVPQKSQPLEVDPRFAGAQNIKMRLHAQITAKISIPFATPSNPLSFEDFISQTEAYETKTKRMALDAFNEITQNSLRLYNKQFITDKSLQNACFLKALNLFKLHELSIDQAYEMPIATFSGIDILHLFNLNPASCIVKPEDLLSFSLKIGPKKILAQNMTNQNNFSGFKNFGNENNPAQFQNSQSYPNLSNINKQNNAFYGANNNNSANFATHQNSNPSQPKNNVSYNFKSIQKDDDGGKLM